MVSPERPLAIGVKGDSVRGDVPVDVQHVRHHHESVNSRTTSHPTALQPNTSPGRNRGVGRTFVIRPSSRSSRGWVSRSWLRSCPFDSTALALVALLGAALIQPATVSAQQPTVSLLTLVDGTACRGPITGTTFSLVDARANYACTDGRWILGEPLTLGDGRQVAMLGRTILQGQRAR